MARNKLKLLIIINTSAYEKTIGGAEINVINIIQNIDSGKYTISFASDNAALISFLERNLSEKIQNIYIIKEYKGLLEDLMYFKTVFNILKKEKPDLIHCHKLKSAVSGRVAGWMLKIPVICTLHGSLIFWDIPKVKKMFNVLIDRLTANFLPNMIIAICQAEKNSMIKTEKIKAHKITTIYNGLFEYPRFFEKKQLVKNKINIITTARLSLGKGHDIIIKAIPNIVKNIPNLKFIFVGDGPLKNFLIKLADTEKAQPFIEFKGELSHQAVLNTLKEGDIFLFPSFWEGLPYSIIEAMFYALPVIATNVGGIPELIINNKGGILIPPKNSDAIKNSIAKLISLPELTHRMGDFNRSRALELFTGEKMINRLEQLYLQLAK